MTPPPTTPPRRRARLATALLSAFVVLVALALDASPERATLLGVEGPGCAVGGALGEAACPGCGLVRATALAAHGDVAASLALHPAGLLVLLVCAAGVVVHGLAWWRGSGPVLAALARAGRVALALGLVAAWAWRGLSSVQV